MRTPGPLARRSLFAAAILERPGRNLESGPRFRLVSVMKPMFLPGVEQNPRPGPYRSLIEQMQKQGSEYPQIWHLFAYLPATEHLARFTQEVLRGPAPLSPGLRELIAAYTSQRNHCPF